MDSAEMLVKECQLSSPHRGSLRIKPMRESLGARVRPYRYALMDSSQEERLGEFAEFAHECELGQEDMVGRWEVAQKPRASESVAAE